MLQTKRWQPVVIVLGSGVTAAVVAMMLKELIGLPWADSADDE